MKKIFLGLAVALLLSLSAQAQQWAPLEPPIEATPRWETSEIIVYFRGIRPKQIKVNDEIFGVTRWERVTRRKKILLPKKASSVSILVAWDEDGTQRTYRVLLFKPTPDY